MVAAGLTACGGTGGCGISSVGAPSCSRLWGIVLPQSGSPLLTSVAPTERDSGRRLDVVHTYHRWYDTFPTSTETTLLSGGHELLINWEPVDRAGRPMSWADIASGSHDTQIDALAGRLRGVGPTLLSFSHEPELNWGAHGDAGAFVAAFRRVHDRLRAGGATNVRFVWNVMGLDQPVWLARYPSLWPGDAYVDWVAWDPYNWGDCRPAPWRSFTQIVSPFYDFAKRQGWDSKPFMLAEYGSVEDSGAPGRKARWLADIPAALKHFPDLRALVYFDVAAPPANCDWLVTTSPRAAAAFGALARNPAFAARSG